eukprot:CAMPEP_0118820340 /NCGR_PEP_ID=MMETSP1162-20130426/7628_1 /TAXON_ID=33656 /ORGANISM="Phaeocystis Sp, Strain CCMP2710" /LENGTH=91 /DNA_ID=CAMNT_0006750717 /DNA_START=321 /DNA_END=596 /DNA_ORIENTATION=-
MTKPVSRIPLEENCIAMARPAVASFESYAPLPFGRVCADPTETMTVLKHSLVPWIPGPLDPGDRRSLNLVAEVSMCTIAPDLSSWGLMRYA